MNPPPNAAREKTAHKMLMKRMLNHFPTVVLLALLLLGFVSSTGAQPSSHGKYIFYVGTYTEDGTKSKGIYAYRFDAGTKQIASLGLAAETTNPSFVAASPDGHFLYAVNEVGKYNGPNSGGVSAFSIDR